MPRWSSLPEDDPEFLGGRDREQRKLWERETGFGGSGSPGFTNYYMTALLSADKEIPDFLIVSLRVPAYLNQPVLPDDPRLQQVSQQLADTGIGLALDAPRIVNGELELRGAVERHVARALRCGDHDDPRIRSIALDLCETPIPVVNSPLKGITLNLLAASGTLGMADILQHGVTPDLIAGVLFGLGTIVMFGVANGMRRGLDAKMERLMLDGFRMPRTRAARELPAHSPETGKQPQSAPKPEGCDQPEPAGAEASAPKRSPTTVTKRKSTAQKAAPSATRKAGSSAAPKKGGNRKKG